VLAFQSNCTVAANTQLGICSRNSIAKKTTNTLLMA
jgi:hypothetical protein